MFLSLLIIHQYKRFCSKIRAVASNLSEKFYPVRKVPNYVAHYQLSFVVWTLELPTVTTSEHSYSSFMKWISIGVHLICMCPIQAFPSYVSDILESSLFCLLYMCITAFFRMESREVVPGNFQYSIQQVTFSYHMHVERKIDI